MNPVFSPLEADCVLAMGGAGPSRVHSGPKALSQLFLWAVLGGNAWVILPLSGEERENRLLGRAREKSAVRLPLAEERWH